MKNAILKEKLNAGISYIRLACCLVAAGLAGVAQAGKTFTFATGETTGYWDDSARWSGDSGGDRHCYQSGTIYMTNAVGYVYQFRMHTTRAAGGLTLHIKNGGAWNTGLYAGADEDSLSYVQFDAGGQYTGGGGMIGVSGTGVVTNYGKICFGEAATIGHASGSYGELVICNGATFYHSNFSKQLTIGGSGTGVVVSLNKNYTTSWSNVNANDPGSPIALGSRGTGHGSLIIEDGAWFRGSLLKLGGLPTDAGGYGELVLRGGTYGNSVDNGNATILFTLGMACGSGTDFSETTYGVIRGWGAFDGDDGTGPSGTYSQNRRWDRSVYAQMGRGEIIGDGEGDESHILDLSKGFCLMTNVLFGVTTTSGWRARNKGAVSLMTVYVGNYTVYEASENMGCHPSLETPDLVNAVRITCRGMETSKNKYYGMRLLAADRSDAHTNSLPTGCNVLSVHQLGVFHNLNPSNRAPVSFTKKSEVKIRYDQTKLTGKTTSRLELWRYKESDGSWTQLTKLQKGERPADLCISGTFTGVATTGSTGDTYNLGTFAVVERGNRGMIVIYR